MILINRRTRVIFIGLIILITIICSMVLVACWDLEDIEIKALVANIALDVGELKEYKLTVQVLLPEVLHGEGAAKAAGEGSPIFVIGAEGQTPFEANRKLHEYVPRRPFFGNTRSVVIGEELARQGVLPALNILEIGHEFRRSKMIYMALGEGGRVLEVKSRIQVNPGDIPVGFMQNLPGIATTVTQTVGDFITQVSSTTTEAVLPVVKVIEGEPEIGNNPEVRVAKTAAFKGDRLVGFLDEKESRGLLWVLGRGKIKGVLSFESPETLEIVTIEIFRNSSSVNATIDDEGRLSVDINIRTEGNLVDQTGFANLYNPQVRRSIERRFAETVRQEIEHALDKAQKELRTDVFGFGGAFFRAYPRVWRDTLEGNWDEFFPYISVNIYVETHVRTTNLSKEAATVGGNR